MPSEAQNSEETLFMIKGLFVAKHVDQNSPDFFYVMMCEVVTSYHNCTVYSLGFCFVA